MRPDTVRFHEVLARILNQSWMADVRDDCFLSIALEVFKKMERL